MKRAFVLSLISFVLLFSCRFESKLESIEFYRLDIYKFDARKKDIDSLVRRDGCFQLNCNQDYYDNYDKYFYKFFPYGEVVCFLDQKDFTSIDFDNWGRYHIQNDTIKAQIYYADGSYKYAADKIEQWFKVINDTTMIRFIRCYNCFDDFYTGRTISDTLRFVKWEPMNVIDKYRYILKQNWQRRLKKNWKEGNYPGDK